MGKRRSSFAEKWIRLKKLLNCTFCPPHKHENATRKPPKYGRTKPRYKNKRIKKSEL